MMMAAIDWRAAELPIVVERLANGLTVIVHTEPKSPIAAVYIAYQAGSRDEPSSQAGLAHLCEHLMFTGTRRNPGSYFAPFEQAGASSMNAFVREDYSAYFATVPVSAVEFAMSMEGDRMVGIAEALNDDKVTRQRDVVINELRQREGQPYGCAPRILAQLTHPAGHPYAHFPDGSFAGVDNISSKDVREWIQARHSPGMATLVIAGDVEPGEVLDKAEHHFGSLPRTPIAPAPSVGMYPPAAPCRQQIELPVASSRLCMAWLGPGFRSNEYPPLEIACQILAGSKSSRLWHRIVLAEQLASDITFELRPRELGVFVLLSITARIGVPLGRIETLVHDEIKRLAAYGPEPDELEIARLRLFGRIVRGFECVGGPHSKSDALGLAAIVGGAPQSHRSRISKIASTRADQVAAAGGRLVGGRAVLEMSPAVRSG